MPPPRLECKPDEGTSIMELKDLEKYHQVVLYGMGLNGKTILPKLREYIKGELLCFDRNEAEYLGQVICTPDFSRVGENGIIIITPTIPNILREMYENIPLEIKNVVTLYDFTNYQELISSNINTGLVLGVGHCPQCETQTQFIRLQSVLELKGIGKTQQFASCCKNCQSIIRERTTIDTLNTFFPNWKTGIVHESSPSVRRIKNMKYLLQNSIGEYSYSYFYPNVPLGGYSGEGRCENLENLTFPDESIDFIISTDVFEHVNDPFAAFASVCRVLKRNGAHVFTVPYHRHLKTAFRTNTRFGHLVNLNIPQYHGNPITDEGALVTVDWGYDIAKYIYEATDGKLKTVVYDDYNPDIGVNSETEGQRTVLISVKL